MTRWRVSSVMMLLIVMLLLLSNLILAPVLVAHYGLDPLGQANRIGRTAPCHRTFTRVAGLNSDVGLWGG